MKKHHFIISISLLAAAVISVLLLAAGCGPQPQVSTKAKFTIVSNPEGAAVLVNDTKLGVTPFAAGSPLNALVIKLDKPGFKPRWERIELKAGESKTFNFDLLPSTGSVMVVSRPDNAKVLIDGQVKGTTPLILQEQPLGSYVAKLEKPGFATRESTWQIKDEIPQLVIVSLNSNVGRLTLTSNPSHAQVFINGAPRGYTPFKCELEEGKYQLKLGKDGYAPIEDYVNILRDQNLEKALTMTTLPGSLEVTTIPPGADISIDDQPHGVSPLKLNSLTAGKYTVKASKSTFDAVSKEIIIVSGQKASVEFVMSKNTGGVDLVVNPPGTSIYLNGKPQGVTQKGENPMLSKIFQIRGVNAGDYEITAAHKRGVPDTKTISVTVTKGQIARPKPISLWVANAELKLKKDGKVSIGLLYAESADKISFGPEPGVKIEYNRKEVEYLKPIVTGDE
jgi:archaellum component FlaG (FlaF/FlaG flagellin family)